MATPSGCCARACWPISWLGTPMRSFGGLQRLIMLTSGSGAIETPSYSCAGTTLRLIHAQSYPRNVSLRRWLNHRAIARRFAVLAKSELQPDVIVSSLPTVELCRAAIRYARPLRCAGGNRHPRFVAGSICRSGALLVAWADEVSARAALRGAEFRLPTSKCYTRYDSAICRLRARACSSSAPKH